MPKLIPTATVFCLAMAAAGATAGCGQAQAQAQDFPARTVRVLVPQAAGGLTDILARTLDGALSERWKQSAATEAHPGAGGIIAAETVAKSAPDGYVLLFTSPGPVVVSAFTVPDLRYDPTTFEPIFNFARSPTIIVARRDFPAKNLDELLKLARKAPDAVSYASPGEGSGLQFEADIFQKAAGVKLLHVPYNSGTEAIRAVAAGETDIGFASVIQAVGPVTQGSVQGIAVSAKRRFEFLPNVPTIAESGHPEFDMGKSWFGYFAPAGTPAAIVDKIAADLQSITSNPEFITQHVVKEGLEPMLEGPADFTATIAKDRKAFRELLGAEGEQRNVK
jgi:tripartite-type tricarboxylate transporter receptor subunit TctC